MTARRRLLLFVLGFSVIIFPLPAQKPAQQTAAKKVTPKKTEPDYFGMTVMMAC
jgi:hypothetical protein